MAEPRALLLTRPRGQSEAFAAVLERTLPGRFAPVIAPLLEIAPAGAVPDLEGAQGVIFTSANGVEQLASRVSARDLPAYCVGDLTAEAARRAGFTAQSADGDVGALADLVIAAHRRGAGDFVHVRGRHAAGDLLGVLSAAGVAARAAEIYDQRPCAIEAAVAAALARGEIGVMAFFSPRTTGFFVEAARMAGWPMGDVVTVALSPAADAPLAALAPGTRVVTETPTRAGMLDALAGV